MPRGRLEKRTEDRVGCVDGAVVRYAEILCGGCVWDAWSAGSSVCQVCLLHICTLKVQYPWSLRIHHWRHHALLLLRHHHHLWGSLWDQLWGHLLCEHALRLRGHHYLWGHLCGHLLCELRDHLWGHLLCQHHLCGHLLLHLFLQHLLLQKVPLRNEVATAILHKVNRWWPAWLPWSFTAAAAPAAGAAVLVLRLRLRRP